MRKPPSKVGGAHHRHRGGAGAQIAATANSKFKRKYIEDSYEPGLRLGRGKKVSNQCRAGPSWRKLTMIAVKVRRRGARMRGGGGKAEGKSSSAFGLTNNKTKRERRRVRRLSCRQLLEYLSRGGRQLGLTSEERPGKCAVSRCKGKEGGFVCWRIMAGKYGMGTRGPRRSMLHARVEGPRACEKKHQTTSSWWGWPWGGRAST